MGVKTKLLIIFTVLIVIVSTIVFITLNNSVPVLQPQGYISEQQRNLIVVATLLMLLVVVPVYILTFAIAWRYRAGNTKAKYSPKLAGNKWLETIWWGVPLFIITILASITWFTSHQLDPFRPLSSQVKPVKVQVVALQWKWLFIYPDQKIATVNQLYIPTDTPINFELTSDAPMNSFWIPSLGGQIYTMSGMSTKLHLSANKVGIYSGSSANISGEGFADMNFKAHAMSKNDFATWTEKMKTSSNNLSLENYIKLAKPKIEKTPLAYGSVEDDLYNTIITKYNNPYLQQEGSVGERTKEGISY